MIWLEISTIYAGTFEGSCEIEKFKAQPSPDTLAREQHALLQTRLEKPTNAWSIHHTDVPMDEHSKQTGTFRQHKPWSSKAKEVRSTARDYLGSLQ